MEKGHFILGEEVARFEEEFSRFCGTRFGVGVASGTDALELALRACRIGAGDRVMTVSFSFLSTADAIRKVGARPLFVDVDPRTYTIDPSQVQALIRRLRPPERRRLKAVLPVHLYGHPCDMDALMALARRERLQVIEDCAQAHGASWKGKPVGSFGICGCFSFYPTKNLGAYGDGGMVVTSSLQIAQRLRQLRFQGRKDPDLQSMDGMNSRLDELQAALLRVKLRRLGGWIEKRRALARLYEKNLKPLSGALQLPFEDSRGKHAYHLYVVQALRREALQKALSRQGISSAVHYRIPIHRQRLYQMGGNGSPAQLAVTDQLARRALSLPLFPEMTPQEIKRVANAILRFYS